jgi:hypothetical protein
MRGSMAVAAIANICEDMLNLSRVAAAGALEVLIGANGDGVIADGHPLVAREAARAVSNLAANPLLAREAAVRGAVPRIAGLLSSGDVLCRRIAARALANLFVSPEATAAAVGPADALAEAAAAKEAALGTDPVAICTAAAAAVFAATGACAIIDESHFLQAFSNMCLLLPWLCCPKRHF